MMISGPWAWANLDRSGIDYGVATLPSINGSLHKHLLVYGPLLSIMHHRIKMWHQNFLRDICSPNRVKHLKSRSTSWYGASQSFMAKLKSDPRIAVTYNNAINGMLMPNVPEMGKFWSSITPALSSMIAGQQTVDAALDNAAKQMTR